MIQDQEFFRRIWFKTGSRCDTIHISSSGFDYHCFDRNPNGLFQIDSNRLTTKYIVFAVHDYVGAILNLPSLDEK